MKAIRFAGLLLLVLVACGPAATPTAPPATTARPTATVAPTSVVAATATPQRPPPGGGATPQPTPTLAPTAVAAATPKYGGTIRYVEWDSPRGWDGHRIKTSAHDVSSQHNLNFSLLFTTYDAALGCKNVLTPNLVENWKWASDTVFEMKLRQGVRFHDKRPVNGREMTAADVAYSINRALFVEPLGGIPIIIQQVAKVEAADPYTVRVVTKAPLSVLVETGLANKHGMVVLAPEAVEPYGNWEDPYRSYIGTGPFTFKDYQAGVKVVYERHPKYFKTGLPYADRVEHMVMPDLSTQMAALRSGKVSLLQRKVPAAVAMVLEKEPDIEVQSCPDKSAPGEIFLRTNQPPLNDVRVRRALSMAVDRKALLDTVLLGRGEMGPLWPASTHPWGVTFDELGPEVRRIVEYHPDEARRLLAEAGYANGLDVSMNASVRYTTPYREYAEALMDMWGKVGVRVKLEWMAHPAYLASFTNYPHLLLGLMVTDDRFLRYGRSYYSASPPSDNRSRINDPEVDDLIQRIGAEVDEAKAKALAKQLEARLVEQVYGINLPVANDHAAIRKEVKGYKFGDPWFTGAWLERLWVDK
ncbi:MAG: ABC transporter substrate-binding protein [Chloroflexi bacterium]|nr:ABC transporter substrate-binding protein [Chloroflexota bacterium]